MLTATGATLPALLVAATNSCSAQGLSGSCNGCICCCYAAGSGGFMRYEPAGCECKKTFSRGEVFLAIVLSVVCAMPTILASCYFSGQCPLSPYRLPSRLPITGGVELAAQAAPTAGVLRRRASR
ncbi:hypothetical protein WJX81_005949 [Elliptochloris bilobata]|uniref:Uncharacterized protein n=1 Tax=Elliptochloris bilobata TaxID=381761 RepID=A0AAW1RYZ5_9CHLO